MCNSIERELGERGMATVEQMKRAVEEGNR